MDLSNEQTMTTRALDAAECGYTCPHRVAWFLGLNPVDDRLADAIATLARMGVFKATGEQHEIGHISCSEFTVEWSAPDDARDLDGAW